MITPQMKQAKKDMSAWLAYPTELGRKPCRIVCTGMFIRNDLRYYIFKFKGSFWGQWMVGVSGGYEPDSMENCGQAFSEMKLYQSETAEEDCKAMVEMICSYWSQRLNK